MIVEADQDSAHRLEILSRSLGAVEVRWKTGSIQTAIDIFRKHLPDMAVIDLGPDPASTLESISSISGDFPSCFLVALSEKVDSGLILRAMRAGAHDFLCKPIKEMDLRATVDKVMKLKAVRQGASNGGGKIISVFSNKGGNGTTTIAVNLADALAHYHGKKTLVVDLVLDNGDVAMFFNVNSTYSLADLAMNAEKADYDFLHSLLVKHSSGVYILSNPSMIEDADRISTAQVRDALASLRSMFDFIILDTPHRFDERTLTALEMSEVVLLVSLLNVPSLKNTHKCLELLGRIGIRDERVKLCMSRSLPNDEISDESVAGLMKCPVFFSVPNDYPTVISAINRGKLLREIAPDKAVARSFQRLAELLAGEETGETASRKKPGLIGKIFRGERSAQ